MRPSRHDDAPHAGHDGSDEEHSSIAGHGADVGAAHVDEYGGDVGEEHYDDGHGSHPDAVNAGHDTRAGEIRTPDLWAEGAGFPGEHAATANETDPGANSARSLRRPLIVLGAVLALTGGGLAATFLAKGPATVASGKGPPTILAASGPAKVKLASSTEVAPEEADAALLSKNGGAPGPAKVVGSQEQPVDLKQLPRASAATGSAESSPFPEPKKVKTFVVHPDGSMVTGASAQPATDQVSRSPPVDMAALAAGAASDGNAAAAAAPRPATPTGAARAVTTPRSSAPPRPESAAVDTADPVSSIGKAKQPSVPGVQTLSRTKPVEVASASTPLVGGAGGGFGLQLAAAPSEQDARDIFSRLQKKYSGQLGALKPTIRKVESGDKSLYRVRVGNLGQDEAKTLCSKLQASGGPCFVVKN